VKTSSVQASLPGRPKIKRVAISGLGMDKLSHARICPMITL